MSVVSTSDPPCSSAVVVALLPLNYLVDRPSARQRRQPWTLWWLTKQLSSLCSVDFCKEILHVLLHGHMDI
ncbi:hypothetical protein EON65_58585 [archaeon]|nr:MAG: hypothetical protein EON65_58585 [archaeon]